jgi:hypothetical protein
VPGKWLVRAGVGLREPPRDEALWRDAQRVSLMHNAIEEAPAKAGGALSDAQPASLMLQCNKAHRRELGNLSQLKLLHPAFHPRSAAGSWPQSRARSTSKNPLSLFVR